MPTSDESMRRLRRSRRKQGLCARCKVASTTYLCGQCRGILLRDRETMKSKRIKKGLCPHCSKVLLNGKCPDRITIRTLVSWVPTNQNLYDAMIASKCSTKDLAVAVGVSQRTITRWLFEGAKPRYPERAELAANYLNTSVDELFRNFNK